MSEPREPRSLFRQEREVHLSDYLNILLRRWKIAVLVFVLVFFGTALRTFLTTPVFEASATLQLKMPAHDRNALTAQFGAEAESGLASAIEKFKSRPIAVEAAKRLNDRLPPAARRPLEELADGIQGSIRVSELGKDWDNDMLRVSSQSTDPQRAREHVDVLVEAYLESSVTSKSREAGKTVEFIGEQLAGLKEKLDQAEQELQEYKVKTGLTTLGPEGGSLVGRVVGLEQQKTELTLKRQRVEYAIDTLQQALKKGQPFTPPVIEGAPQVAESAARLAELEAARKSMLVNFTPAHPAVLEKETEIRRVQEAMLSAYQSLRQELQLAERDASRTIAGYDAQLKEVPETELELAKRTRVHKVNAELYNFLLQKQQEAQIAAASTLASIEVIDPARTPRAPVTPNTRKNLALGLVLGLMLGVGLVFLIDYMDQTIKTADDVRDKLGLSVLGIIPRIPFADEQARLPSQRLVTTLAPHSPVVEAFRALRTNLNFLTLRETHRVSVTFTAREDGTATASGNVFAREPLHRVILVTSSLPDEGKSTVSGNLAVIIAQTGAKVLLVGCDLRRPSLYTMFGQESEPGLTNLLIEERKGSVRRLTEPPIDFLPAGTIPPNPVEILASERMKKFLATARERYDYVILDAPPVLPVTDAQVLAPLADMILVVLEPCRVPERAALQMVESLTAVNGRVSGVILNDKSGRGFRYYGSYNYYGNKYYRGYYGEAQDDHRDPPALAAVRKVWDKLNS